MITTVELSKLLAAEKEGRIIQCRAKSDPYASWFSAPLGEWDFEQYEYRVMRKKRTAYANIYLGHGESERRIGNIRLDLNGCDDIMGAANRIAVATITWEED
jgi:hypothetical protein